MGQPRTLKTPGLETLFSQKSPEPVTFVNTILHESIELAASDILLEPTREKLRVRARIDGVLYELGSVGLKMIDHVSSRIKILSKLDPAEKRKIQEGQFTLNHKQRIVNLRVEIAQTIHGELVVVRIHERETIVMDLAQLGFNPSAYKDFLDMLRLRSGLILVCGPTGCGKTTTLYSTMAKLNENQNYNVMTIEDPVEFQLENTNQMQVQEKSGFTFATGLSTILRLSPDIILVGEIRDRETAQMAVGSGLAGQLVLSTLHAEDSIGTLLRLLDLDIENYLLNSALRGVVAQRLVRRICQACKAPYQPPPDENDLFLKVLGRPPKSLTRGKGCNECRNLAYKGQAGIFEILNVDAQVRTLIRNKADESTFRETLSKSGLTTLLKDGLEKCEQGITTVEEVLKNSFKVF